MEEIKKKFPCRINELPTVGKFIVDSFERDKADFGGYTDFADPFENSYKAALLNVNNLVNPITYTLEMKKVTFGLYSNIFGLRDVMNVLQNYVNNAGNALNVLPDDFGFKEVRRNIKRLDVEGLSGALNVVETNVANNFTVLKTKGYTTEMQNDLLARHVQILADNAMQNKLTNDRNEQANDNMKAYNDFYTSYAGKTSKQAILMYKVPKPGKVDDYTIAALVRRIRQEQLRSSASGTVKDADGKAAAKSDIVFKPVLEGRTRKTKTDVNGKFVIKSLTPGDYNMLVTFGGVTKVVQVNVATGQKVVVNVTM